MKHQVLLALAEVAADSPPFNAGASLKHGILELLAVAHRIPPRLMRGPH